ncbi:MAG: hypothetical protein Q4Q20_06110 [Methanocorpusculum sp.]|nr:hypothetical protein [Methanocorpusculum sp.]
MDEPAKTEARNYLTAAGFFVLAAYFILIPLMMMGSDHNTTIHLISGIGLLLIGTLLIILRKRDMIAILFMLLSFFYLSLGFIQGLSGPMIALCFYGLILLTMLVTMTGRDKAKWLLMVIPLLLIIACLVRFAGGITGMIVFFLIAAIISIYFALACASERINLPGRKLLTADEETDFKASGSVLGYLLFAVISGSYVVYYIVGEAMMHLEYLHTITIVAAVLLIFIAVLLFAVGKMRFTPIMFLSMGLLDLLGMYSSGAMLIGVGILWIIIGVFAMLRKESRILPGIMLVVYGCTYFFTAYGGGNMPVVSVILNGLPCLIAIYLAFVVYSQKKLPKF